MSSELEPTGLSGIVHPPREVWTLERKLEIIAMIVETQSYEQNSESDGDKYLASPYYSMEAIEAVLGGNYDNALLRAYLEAPARGEAVNELEEWK